MKNTRLMIAILAIALSTNMIGQEVTVNTEKSTIQWTGKKVTGEHTGTIQLKDATLKMKNDAILEGKVVMNMASITNTDLTDQEYNQKLIGHLKSDDFFSVAKYPTAELIITGSTPMVNNEMTVKGNLTIKGITKPIEFKATKNNDKSFTAIIVVDRAKYDVRYGSGSFFDGLGDKMIYDDFEINATLVVEKS